MNAENTKAVNEYVAEMNTAIDSVKRSSAKMFDVLKKAHQELNPDDFEKFKSEINLERSSINKMLVICKSEFVKENAEKLPISWGTLYVIAGIKEEHARELLDKGKLTSSSTKNSVIQLKNKAAND